MKKSEHLDTPTCPRCGEFDGVVRCEDWEATSLVEEDNTCVVAEYQCKHCTNQSFWI